MAATPQTESREPNAEVDAPITPPKHWEIITESPHAEHDDSILLEHVHDDFTAEVWQRPEDVAPEDADNPELYGPGAWDVEYVDPERTRRDGSNTFHDDPQAAINALAPHIQEARALRRDTHEQRVETEQVDWPEEIGGFSLRSRPQSDTRAKYHIQYLVGRSGFLTEYRGETIEVRYYKDTRSYHVDGGSQHARKAAAIDELTEILNAKTEQYREIERETVEENDIPDHHSPNHI